MSCRGFCCQDPWGSKSYPLTIECQPLFYFTHKYLDLVCGQCNFNWQKSLSHFLIIVVLPIPSGFPFVVWMSFILFLQYSTLLCKIIVRFWRHSTINALHERLNILLSLISTANFFSFYCYYHNTFDFKWL